MDTITLSELRYLADVTVAVEGGATVVFTYSKALPSITGSLRSDFFTEEGEKAGDEWELEDLYVIVDWHGPTNRYPEISMWSLPKFLRLLYDGTVKIKGYAHWQ